MKKLNEKDIVKLNFILNLLKIKEKQKAEELLEELIKELNIESDIQYFEIKQAAIIKGVSEKSIRRRVKENTIPFFRSGKGGKLHIGIRSTNLPTDWLENLGIIEENE